jgi:Zn-dependent metalloprotease
MFLRRRLLRITSIFVILTILFSGFPVHTTLAQGQDGLKRQVNPQTGKVSFLGPENGTSLSASQALGAASPARPGDPARALARRFGLEFGLKSPDRDLSPMKTHRAENGRIMARYQQTYQGVPVIGGELIVNTNDSGDLYSMNGEVSPDLSLSTQPMVDSEQARKVALQAAAKWYQKTLEYFVTTEPKLWIYDESLLRPSTRPAELVWRMEVTPTDVGMPVRELVLVNAHRGSISLHFNQVDTAWGGTGKEKTSPILPATQQDLKSSSDQITRNTPASHLALQKGAIRYVATSGNDSNSCSSAGSPCATINGAIGKAANGDTIKVATGTYTGSGTEVVLINKSITLSGGWNASFTAQTGTSTIDGQAARRGIMNNSGVTSTIERFVVQNCYINNGTPGAGIENSGGTMTLKESTISGNDAGYSGYGGGIANVLGGVLTINSSTVSGNKVNQGGGGGIVNGISSTLTLNNSTVSGNTTNYDGGGIDMTGGTLIVNNSTIYGNSSTYTSGAGIYNNGGGSVVLKNTILAENSEPFSQRSDCTGPITSAGYNFIGSLDSGDCTFTPTTGDIVGPSYLPPIDPLLTPLQNNGGFTLTHALYSISRAFNAGNPATPGSGGDACFATDQRGVARPAGGRCDIGAYEGSIPWAPPYRVSTYTASDTASLPGTFLCNQNDPNCASGDAHAKSAHKYTIGTYNFYATHFGRNSLDNNGMTIVSSVHYCESNACPYYNASWTGEQVVYGDAYEFPLADDVVAHELTHGVTQYESNLFYYYQSGAINESFSDVFGEYYDQINGLGQDKFYEQSPGFKWLLGEDVYSSGPIRSMSNPPAYGDPDKMSSPNYFQGEDDDGGVHYNSGINNKAAYLMVDGGSFNGKTVSPLGWDKTAALYYEVNTNLLSSGADYSDLYYALQQACTNLIGQKGITAGDCAEVRDAIEAVEMNGQPTSEFNTDAPYCEAGNPVATIFSEGLESGTGNWTFANGAHPRWQVDSKDLGPFAQSGLHSLYADDDPGVVTDATARLRSFFVPSNTYLRFAQAYGFESGYNTGDPTLYDFDGGVLEYSLNNGASWVDAGSLIDVNGYKGIIFTGAKNPLSGRPAFVGNSHGYISTRLNLSPLVGQNVSFRWRMGLDEAGSASGWWVDNIQVYACPVALSADTTGVFRPTNGALYLKNTNVTGFADVQINYGLGGDYPVVGDWDGNGTATIGIYRNGSFYLRNENTIGFADIVFPFGSPGDQPVAGDWDNDGVDTIGVYRSGTFYLRNENSAGDPQMSFSLGVPGDVGIAGDWNGDGVDTTGVFRPSNGALYLKNTNVTGFADIQINYGLPGDRPVTGDWNDDGIDSIGIYRNGVFYLRNSNTIGFADIVFGLGVPGDMPIAGNWDAMP